MACPTCDGTMQNIGVDHQKIFWCHRCGTLKSIDPTGFEDISLPTWVRRNATVFNGVHRIKDGRWLDELSKNSF